MLVEAIRQPRGEKMDAQIPNLAPFHCRNFSVLVDRANPQ